MALRTTTAAALPGFELPIVIPVFNNLTYLANTLTYFQARGFEEYLLLNNGSQHAPLEAYLSSLPDGVTILDLPHNPGPRIYHTDPEIYDRLPDKFILTDPDLGFDPALDRETILHLFELCKRHRRYKVGCALNIEISEPNCLDVPVRLAGRLTTIRKLEQGYYQRCIGTSRYGDAIFDAPIDTTFAVHMKRYFAGSLLAANYRVAGRYTAHHYGWYDVPPIPAEEYEFYMQQAAGSEKHYSSTECIRHGRNFTY